MSYTKLIKKLYQVNINRGVKLGLENAKTLHKVLHCPLTNVPCVHVAGTNGKGSVSTKIAKVLQLSGYNVGLYTSPHISTFRERIRVNSEPIQKNRLEELLESIFHKIEDADIKATFFEITTLLAFKYFEDSSVDVAVIETGIGGRLDATNILQSKFGVITSIDFDHMNFLGDTLEKIASEKAGIIKPNMTLILGPNAVQKAIYEKAASEHVKVCQVTSTHVSYDQVNREIALQTIKKLKGEFSIKSKAIQEGLKETPPCRFEEYFSDRLNKLFILDVAHNNSGLEALFKRVNKKNYSIVFALSRGKDYRSSLKEIEKNAESLYFFKSSHPRIEEHKVIEETFTALSSKKTLQLTDQNSIINYLKKDPNSTVVVCGSHFIMSDFRSLLGIIDEKDPIELNEVIL